MQPIRDCEVQSHSAPGCWNPLSDGIYFHAPPWENFSSCAPVDDVVMWAFHWDLAVPFISSLLF